MTRWAEPPTAASTMTNSSISASLAVNPVSALPQIGWTMNTSAPRTDSSKRQYTSPLAKVLSVTGARSTSSRSAIREASAGFALPDTSIRRFSYPWAIRVACADPAMAAVEAMA